MVNLDNVVRALSESGAVSGLAGGLVGGTLAGALSGKKGRKVAKSALKVGAVAAVGGLAYSAYRRYRTDQVGNTAGTATPAPGAGGAGSSEHLAAHPVQVDPVAQRDWDHIDRARFEAVATDSGGERSGGLLLVRAMIAAAAADGHMDDGERARIFDEAQRLDLPAEDKGRLFDELRQPLSVEQIVSEVGNPETAIEVYTASLVAIDEERPEAQIYLRELAAALQLPDALVTSLHTQMSFIQRNKAA